MKRSSAGIENSSGVGRWETECVLDTIKDMDGGAASTKSSRLVTIGSKNTTGDQTCWGMFQIFMEGTAHLLYMESLCPLKRKNDLKVIGQTSLTFKVGQSDFSLPVEPVSNTARLSIGLCRHMRRRPERAPERAKQPRLNSSNLID